MALAAMKEGTLRYLRALVAGRELPHGCAAAVERAYELIESCYRGGNKVLVCGNGGSAADSEHIVAELMKGFRLRRPLSSEQRQALQSVDPEGYGALADCLQQALPALSLVSHSALITAFSNDVSPETAFAQQVLGYGKPGDLLIAISTSGQSRNVVAAVKVAKAFGLATVALTGEAEGPLSELCTVTVRVPARDTAAVQEYHLAVYHALCSMVEHELFADE